MKDGLIDRLKVVRHSRDSVNTRMREKIFVQIHIDLLDEAIAALSPILPEEIRDLGMRLQFRIAKLSGPGWLMPNCVDDLKDARDLIERLWLEYDYARNERNKAEQRIEELEQKELAWNKDSVVIENLALREEIKRLDAALAEIESKQCGYCFSGITAKKARAGK